MGPNPKEPDPQISSECFTALGPALGTAAVILAEGLGRNCQVPILLLSSCVSKGDAGHELSSGLFLPCSVFHQQVFLGVHGGGSCSSAKWGRWKSGPLFIVLIYNLVFLPILGFPRQLGPSISHLAWQLPPSYTHTPSKRTLWSPLYPSQWDVLSHGKSWIGSSCRRLDLGQVLPVLIHDFHPSRIRMVWWEDKMWERKVVVNYPCTVLCTKFNTNNNKNTQV